MLFRSRPKQQSPLDDKTSKLPSLHLLELLSARGAEFAQQVDGPTVCHLTQFGEALVRLKIRVQNLSSNGFGAIHHLLGGQDAHPAELRIETHQTRYISLAVLKRVDVALAGLFNKLPIKNLPAILLALEPLGANIDSMAEPICSDACQAADGCAGQCSQRGNDGGVHYTILN